MVRNKIKFGIIILNYFSYQETINCIESFSKADRNDFKTFYVIVDNGSSNESYKILNECYKTRDDVSVIKLDQNIGFAKGNNEGYKYLNEKYNCDYYIFSNSDILVPNNIFSWISTTYEKNNCDILGPDIYAPKLGIHQNPIKKYTQIPLVVDIKIAKKCIERFLIRKFHVIIKTKKNRNVVQENKEQVYGCPVHGSFIITNNKIFEYYEDFFDNHTFLYMEEYLLYLRCKKYGIRTLVSLDGQVTHLQGKSTDTSMSSVENKKINRLDREIASMIIYKKMLKKLLYAEKEKGHAN